MGGDVQHGHLPEGSHLCSTCHLFSELVGAGSVTVPVRISSAAKIHQNFLKKCLLLDYLVLTHPDADHIGGADVIVTKFAIGNVFMTDFKKDNKTYQNVRPDTHPLLRKGRFPVYPAPPPPVHHR